MKSLIKFGLIRNDKRVLTDYNLRGWNKKHKVYKFSPKMAPVNIRTMWLINEKVEILGKDI
jgi:hypothetical protein